MANVDGIAQFIIDPVDVKSFKYNNSNNNDLYYRLASSASCAGK